MLDLLTDPATPVAPHRGESGGVSIWCGRTDRNRFVGHCELRSRKCQADAIVEAASAAYHAEPLLRLLCEQFEDPVRSVAISDDNFVVIRINADDERDSDARIVVSPRGEAAFHLHRDGRSPGGFLDVHNDYPLPPSAVRKLTGFGIRGRREAH